MQNSKFKIAFTNLFVKARHLALDILFPKICINCRKYLSDSQGRSLRNGVICTPCFTSIHIDEIYSETESPPAGGFILGAATSYEDKTVKELIYALKYKRLAEAAKPLAEMIIKHIEASGLNEIIIPSETIIIPIPLHGSRLRKRGYNQSELIANIIGKHLDIPVRTDILKRIKNTSPQIEMKTHEKRAENLKGSFEISKPSARTVLADVRNKQIILVDDIFTSGATLKEAVKILKKLKPSKIIALVAARAGH